MNTAFLLMAQYGGAAVIPIDAVCRDYFWHLSQTSSSGKSQPARSRCRWSAWRRATSAPRAYIWSTWRDGSTSAPRRRARNASSLQAGSPRAHSYPAIRIPSLHARLLV